MATENHTQRAPTASAGGQRKAPAAHGRSWFNGLRRRPSPAVVDVGDPLRGAIKDAEVLLAFAAQSRHPLAAETIQKMTAAVQAVKRHAGQSPAQDEICKFWLAYDALANELAPLSAESIRASMKLNGTRFPFSLFTATAVNALLAFTVFFICIMLQGFWSAGRELLDKAEALEAQQTEMLQRLQRNQAVIDRRKDQLARLSWQLCPPGGYCTDGFPDDEAAALRVGTVANGNATKLRLIGKEEEAKLRAQKQLFIQEMLEKAGIVTEQREELRALNNRSRAVQDVIVSWHERATSICTQFGALCPIAPTGKEAERVADLRSAVESLQIAVRAREALADAEAPHGTPAAVAEVANRRDLQALVFEKGKRETALAAAEADEFRATLHRVRLTLVNIGSNFLPMFMGLLGALTYILRSLTIQLRDHTYVQVSLSLSVVRICLGAVAGVFGAMMVPGSDGALKALPPLVVPFVFGYGIEILFSMMDRVVNSFTQQDQAKAATRAPA